MMDRKYWEFQVEIIDLFTELDMLKYLKNTVNEMVLVVSCVDSDILDRLDRICEIGGLCYNYSPQTYANNIKRNETESSAVLFKFTAKE